MPDRPLAYLTAVLLGAAMLLATPPAAPAQEGSPLERAKRAAAPACGETPLGRFVADFLVSPTWEQHLNDDGTVYIDAYGPLRRNNNKLVVARVRYLMNGSGPLVFHSMDITGIAQPEQTYVALARQVCR